MKKAIAFFDFDGTITTKDTLLEFIRFTKGNLRFYFGFLLNSPYLLAFKAGLIPNQTAKEKVLHYFFNNEDEKVFMQRCRSFAKNRLPSLIRQGALEEIRKLKEKDIPVVVVSASPECWIQPWADQQKIHLIASRLEVDNGKITGRLIGKNCHGKEKVKRILEQHTMKDYEEIYAYGDSSGDRPMLELATHSFYKPFRK
ncbi:MAG TPA: HAD-IB family hydrolase [Flavisolibacter sp.]|nr:HAD-IB family hydrolase [Flavisolibacter sp.]